MFRTFNIYNQFEYFWDSEGYINKYLIVRNLHDVEKEIL